MPLTIVVSATWDEEAGVWVATSNDLPGLVTEAETLDALDEKLMVMVPELIELNAIHTHDLPEVPVVVMAQSMMKVPLAAG